jgi:uncharacterized protein
MKLPTPQQCLDYFDQYKVPANIKAHCVKVQKVAVFIAEELHKVGADVDVEVVRAASVLHDLFKVVVLKSIESTADHKHDWSEEEIEMWKELREKYPGMYENEVAFEIFKDEYPEFAVVLRREGEHLLRERSLTDAIIHHADYILLRDGVISLDERFAYLRRVYQNTSEYWDEFLAYCKQEEARIFEKLPFTPEELKMKFEESTK